MNRLLITPFLFVSFISAGVAAYLLWDSQFALLWLGTFIAAAPLPVSLLASSILGLSARQSPNLPLLQGITAGGLLLTLYSAVIGAEGNEAYGFAVVIGLFSVGFVQWYLRIYAPYNRTKSEGIVIGQPLPDLVFETVDGADMSSNDFVGHKTLIVFFRANWCPLCMTQIKQLLGRTDRLLAADVNVVFVSNQSTEHSKALKERMEFPEHFDILVDRDLRAAKQLGIEDIGGTPFGMAGYPVDTVMATVIALDEKGNVLFGDETDNYRRRPHPDTFLDMFDTPSATAATVQGV